MVNEPEGKQAPVIETPLDPDIPICDAHHHFYYDDRRGSPYTPQHLLRDIGDQRVVKTVYIECRTEYRKEGAQELRPVGETEFVAGITADFNRAPARTALAAGIVGFAELRLGKAVESVLEAHMAAGGNRFRGVRYSSIWDADPGIQGPIQHPPRGLLLDAKFREGFACLRRQDLSFDSWVFFHQLDEVADLAAAFPDITIILDHIGNPVYTGPYAARREEVTKLWKQGIAALAPCKNVYIKIGGQGMPRWGFEWNKRPVPPGSEELAAAMKPYFHWCIEQLGVERCMFESNFPVDKRSYAYGAIWNAFKRITQDFSRADRSALFHDTAAKAYRI